MSDQDAVLGPLEAPRSDAAAPAAANPFRETVRPYAYYALVLLVLANFLNYVDRQIVSILAQSLKAEFGLTDAQLGFLLGTAFAVLYGVVGIAIGRISDAVTRTRLLAFGLALWSAMTVVSAAAMNYAGLAAARIGVGVGEASASPTAQSLLTDYFPARQRATALGVYLLGTSMGGVGALLLGGAVLQHWSQICQVLPIPGACHLANWRAAFLVVGLPGLVLALLIANLREPPRQIKPRTEPLVRLIAREMGAALPPFTLVSLYRVGGRAAVSKNLLLVAALVAGAGLLGKLTHDWPQWVAVAIGIYSISTWAQVMSHRDRPLFALTYGSPTYAFALAGGALLASITAPVGIWAAPYAMRRFGLNPGQAGLELGLAYACAASISVVLAGMLTDLWKRRDPRAPVWMALISLAGSLPCLATMMSAPTQAIFLAGYLAFGVINTWWAGAYAALVFDIVLPRMRGAASAAFTLVIIVVSSGIGPYWAGKISTVTGSLATGLWSLQVLSPIALTLLLLAARRLKHETDDTRRARARAAGEDI